MAIIFSKLAKAWNSSRKLILLIFSAIILSLFSIYIFSQTRLAGDVASHLLLAVSPILKIGSPYKNFWEIKPPVWPLTVYLWSSLFGFSILSIRIINIIIMSLVALSIWFVFKKAFQTPVFEILFFFTILIVPSPLLNSIILPTEILGLLFSMLALAVLVSMRKDSFKFFFSGLLFFAASQTKEPFTLTAIAVLPVLIYSLLQGGFIKAFKNSMQFLFGMLASFFGIFIYLANLGSAGAYLEVFKFKQVFFPFSYDRISENLLPGFSAAARTFTEFVQGFPLIIFLAICSFYLVNVYKKTFTLDLHKTRLITKPMVILNSDKIIKYSIILYALGSFLGFGLGGTYGSHYLIQVVVPFYIINGFLFSYLFKNVTFLYARSRPYFYFALILFVFSVAILMPKRQYLSSYFPQITSFTMTDQIHSYEKIVTQLTTSDQCILSVYGWGVSENYLYSMRKPCTRYFLANIVLQDWQKKEYSKEIIENPPAVIIYQTAGADMDIQRFESQIINIGKIVDKDLKEDVVFVPKIFSREELKSCIAANSI